MPEPVIMMPPPAPSGASASYNYHAFVIYTDVDADWCIRELITPLEKVGVNLIHKRAFKLGVPLFRTEDESIRKSLCTIAFLTAEWVKSSQDTFLADRAWALERLVPVLAEECEPDPRVKQLSGIDLTDPAHWKAEFQRLLQHLGRSAQDAQAAATLTVVRGLKAISRLMRIQPVQQAVSKYEVSFTAAASEIELISRFKALHDDFQTAEGSFRLVAERKIKGADNIAAGLTPLWEELEEGLDDLLADLRQLQKTASQSALPAHMISWTGQLESVVTGLTQLLAAGDDKLIASPLEVLERILGIWPSRINTRIVEGVARLSLAAVADGLQSVRDTLTEYYFDELADALFDDFKKSVASLRTLARNLDALHANHDWLQAINDSLAPLQRTRNPAPTEIKVQWQFVVGPVSQLDPAAGPSWVNDFQNRAVEVTKALTAANDPAGVRSLHRAFNTFRTELDKVFNRADRDLLTLCEGLKTVGQALRQTIGRMQNG